MRDVDRERCHGGNKVDLGDVEERFAVLIACQEGVVSIGQLLELDDLWRPQRLVVKLDGRPYHVAVQNMEKDRVRTWRCNRSV